MKDFIGKGNVMKVSIVVPCYNEEKTVPLFFNEVKNLREYMNLNICLLMMVQEIIHYKQSKH